MSPSKSIACPCGSGVLFDGCCAPFLSDASIPETAEQLMRSRYTAYVLGKVPYLQATWHPSTRPAELSFGENFSPRWLGLSVRRVERGGPQDESGIVEFVARYKIAGKAHRLHEVSRFQKENGRWLYVDGTVTD